MGVLAKTDYGREYTVKEKSDFAQLILVSDLGTVQVGEFMQARSWPGMLGSTLLELQRAVKRENVNDDRYLNSIFVLQKKKARRKKGQENELLDDQAEARQCELAWEWPGRRATSTLRLEAAMRVPPLIAKDLVDEFRAVAVAERANRMRQLRMRTDDRPRPRGPEPGHMLINLVEVALTEHAEIANPEKPLVEALVWGSIAQDRSSPEAQAAAIHCAFHTSMFQWQHRNALRSPGYAADDVRSLGRHLLAIQRGASPKRSRARGGASAQAWSPEEAAAGGALGVLRALMRHGDVVARIGACCALADLSRYLTGAVDLGPPLASDVVRLIHSTAPKQRRGAVGDVSGELLPTCAVVAVASLVNMQPDKLRGPLVEAGVLQALLGALRESYPGARTVNGNATPTALILPRHAMASLCSLCNDVATRRKARKIGCLDAATKLLTSDIDPRSGTCRLAYQEALRFVSLYMLLDDASDALNEAVVPGALRLTRAPEVAVRKAALNSLLYVVQRVEANPTFLLKTNFLEAIEDLLSHYKLRGEILRILLVLAKNEVGQELLKFMGFCQKLEAIAADKSNAAINRSLALRVLFTMGEFDFFDTGDALRCSHGDPEMRRDVRSLENLIEERLMQLAFDKRPEIEKSFSKIELKTYKRLFNDFSEAGPPRGVEVKRVRELLKKCCTVFRDYKTRRHMTKKNCNRVVSIYDTDFSGKIEWAEFLAIMTDLKQGTLMDRVTSMFSFM